MAQLYLPSWLSIPVATLSPTWRWLLSLPSRRAMVIVPVTFSGSQTMSKVDPTVATWPSVGEEMASNPAVWALAKEVMAANKVAETNE